MTLLEKAMEISPVKKPVDSYYLNQQIVELFKAYLDKKIDNFQVSRALGCGYGSVRAKAASFMFAQYEAGLLRFKDDP